MNRTTWWIPMGLIAFALGGVGVRQLARAQDGTPGPPGGGPGFPGRMMGGGGGAQIAASGTSVFVLRGNTIYRLDAATLKVTATGQLPAPEGGPPPRAEAPGVPADANGADPALIAHGKQVFGTAGCMNCHRFNGQGTGRAPDLAHVGAEQGHTAEFIASVVRNPQAVNPGAHMPAFGGKLAEEDIKAVGTYLASLK